MNTKRPTGRERGYPCRLRSGVALAALAFALPGVAHAQDGDPAAPQETQQAEHSTDIVVSGTRIVRDGYTSPSPTLVIGAEELNARAPSTIVDAFATMPAFKQSSTTSVGTNSAGSSVGQSLINLRGLGANRTLIQLNDQRMMPTNADGTVDVALIPASLLSRVDVVTGGASAAYGSDAVAGVVNFVLDTSYRSIKGSVQKGISSRDDGELSKYSLTFGTDIGSRLSIVATGEYYDNEGVLPGTRRKAQSNIVTNPSYVPGSDQYRFYVEPYVYFSSATYGGRILNGPLAGQQFENDGTLTTAPRGSLVGAQFMAMPGYADLPYTTQTAFFAAPQERVSAYGRASYELTDNLSVYVDALYGKSRTQTGTSAASTLLLGSFTIQATNPFLPDAVRTTLQDANVSSFTMGRYFRDLGYPEVFKRNELQRYSGGLTWDFGGGWTAKAYYSHGESKSRLTITDDPITARFRESVDAVDNNGTISCRSSLANPNNGCVPINIFGEQVSFSKAQRAYFLGTNEVELNYKQDAASASITGEPFSTWAGPVSLATGFEYRKESAHQTADPISQAGGFMVGNQKALDGSISVKEGFVEVLVPLAKDSAIGESLDLNAAARLTDYSTSGSVVTWKAGVTYRPISSILLRATRSRDIRAPNIIELFSSLQQVVASTSDPFTKSTYFVRGLSSGNPNLDPEKADTTSVGAVFTPDFLPGFGSSLDYYSIKIGGAITTLTTQQIVDRCFAGEADLCSLVTRDPTTQAITEISSRYLNLNRLETEGLDIAVSYRSSLEPLFGNGAGDVTFRAVGNRLLDFGRSNGPAMQNTTGSLLAGQPKWSWYFLSSYENGPFAFQASLTRIGSGKFDATLIDGVDIGAENNRIGSVTYLDLGASVKAQVGDLQLRFFANANNVLDRKPPVVFAAGIPQGPNYDLVGRYFKAGLEFEF